MGKLLSFERGGASRDTPGSEVSTNQAFLKLAQGLTFYGLSGRLRYYYGGGISPLTVSAFAIILKVARLYVVGEPSDYVEVPS